MTEGYHEMLEEVGACYSSCQDFLTEVNGKKSSFFYVLLTVHLSIILVTNQLNAKNLVS